MKIIYSGEERGATYQKLADTFSCVSAMKAPHGPHGFEPESPDSKKKKTGVCEEELLSCCSLCRDVLKDPVSTSCGHWFCRQCITSYCDHSDASGLCSCPQCGETSRTREGLQTFSQNRTVKNGSQDGLQSEGPSGGAAVCLQMFWTVPLKEEERGVLEESEEECSSFVSTSYSGKML
ncbi:E3 ubiquitin-protein ligase TRIM58 [Oryzias melastigma]|uniref:E3 ubiquitin-protein ligase TRIM58 n=1 Tax=Oryzias melastigma TaxID=30732 RepID=A0A834CFF9_ORYME|nr:E3 ubiquitin-protein ligase TRIM58 [Oryzias melastigma]